MKKMSIGTTSKIGLALAIFLCVLGVIGVLGRNLELALASTLGLIGFVALILLGMRRSQARLLERSLDMKRQLSLIFREGITLNDRGADIIVSTIVANFANDLDRRELAGGASISEFRKSVEEALKMLRVDSKSSRHELESGFSNFQKTQSDFDKKLLDAINGIETTVLASARKNRNHLSTEGATNADLTRRRFGDIRRENERSTNDVMSALKTSEKRLVGLIEGSRFANDYEMKEIQERMSLLSESNQDISRAVSLNLVELQELTATHMASREAARVELNRLVDTLSSIESSSQSFFARNEQLGLISENLIATIREESEKSLAKHRQTLVNRLTNLVRGEIQQVEAIVQLFARIAPRSPMPPTGLWAIDARALLHLVGIVESRTPKVIVELGSGTSTIWLGYLAESIGAKVISFDHLEKYYDQTRSLVNKHGLENVIDLRLAALHEQEFEGVSTVWYDVTRFSDIQNIDLLVIDGPPSNVGPAARYPALPALIERMSDECVVVLDDSERDGEQDAINRWLHTYPEFKHADQYFSRLAILQRDGTDQ